MYIPEIAFNLFSFMIGCIALVCGILCLLESVYKTGGVLVGIVFFIGIWHFFYWSEPERHTEDGIHMSAITSITTNGVTRQYAMDRHTTLVPLLGHIEDAEKHMVKFTYVKPNIIWGVKVLLLDNYKMFIVKKGEETECTSD